MPASSCQSLQPPLHRAGVPTVRLPRQAARPKGDTALARAACVCVRLYVSMCVSVNSCVFIRVSLCVHVCVCVCVSTGRPCLSGSSGLGSNLWVCSVFSRWRSCSPPRRSVLTPASLPASRAHSALRGSAPAPAVVVCPCESAASARVSPASPCWLSPGPGAPGSSTAPRGSLEVASTAASALSLPPPDPDLPANRPVPAFQVKEVGLVRRGHVVRGSAAQKHVPARARPAPRRALHCLRGTRRDRTPGVPTGQLRESDR